MEVKEMDIAAKSGFLFDYLEGHPSIGDCFDYSQTDNERFKKRVRDLKARSFPRDALVEHLYQTHNELPYNHAVKQNIEKLLDPQTVAVVGGQQAGLLTGPLYTVYKAMTIILLAKEQERALDVPVVPIFWVAGEDHDLEEVRFVYTNNGSAWKKSGLDIVDNMQSLSKTNLPVDKVSRWLDDVFKTLPETDYTEDLTAQIKGYLENSHSFVDFFSILMNWLFKDEGLILLDSDHPALRKVETDYFMAMVDQVEELQKAQAEGEKRFSEKGYGDPISTDKENAHLFYTVKNERKRLDYKDGSFYVRGTDIQLSKSELVDLITKHPEHFSNNVVTRPIMQEMLLPVLTFVAGPGELRYWATLKPAFTLFNLKMPPLTPRMQMTIVPRHVQRWVEECGYSYESLLTGKAMDMKSEWLEAIENYPIEEVVTKAEQSIRDAHKDIQLLANEMDDTLHKLSQKNEVMILDQLDFIKRKLELHLEQKHSKALSKFDEADSWLYPLKRPQERVIHPILLLNLAGYDAIGRIMKQKLSLNPTHKLVFL
ncbi:bacillithiol biosynthesis cysteine-adding enzyme BshC [Alkalihalophilus pseudofirmus]|uniref:bacillithiol biosynthesis cysteine-adding enzyme BshC n=1 Tax=Alkalihalophilus pseudofirmus TaxID=79885 RepID=UPI0009519E5C|nr:bacillithiol biosynthesis cysteine-adding enzyme BshC [Alkalihalophilus pseudofirmus]